jgi:hypothetical protein
VCVNFAANLVQVTEGGAYDQQHFLLEKKSFH